MPTYSFSRTLLWKGAKYFIIFLLPMLADSFVISYPRIAQLTVGAILVMIVNWLKVQAGLRFS